MSMMALRHGMIRGKRCYREMEQLWLYQQLHATDLNYRDSHPKRDVCYVIQYRTLYTNAWNQTLSPQTKSVEGCAHMDRGRAHVARTAYRDVVFTGTILARIPNITKTTTAAHARMIHHSEPWQFADVQVKVPPLGESITDGAVAAVLKSAGDNVEEDEPIVQIETDKVTIDVRSPVSGTIKAILVEADDTVKVDHVVATLSEGESPGRVEGAPPKPATEHLKKNKDMEVEGTGRDASPSPPPSSHAGHSRGHTPRISFPTRITPDGKRISEMSAEEQEKIRGEEASSKKQSMFFMQRQKIERPPLPPRRELSEREMEIIMLGGAE